MKKKLALVLGVVMLLVGCGTKGVEENTSTADAQEESIEKQVETEESQTEEVVESSEEPNRDFTDPYSGYPYYFWAYQQASDVELAVVIDGTELKLQCDLSDLEALGFEMDPEADLDAVLEAGQYSTVTMYYKGNDFTVYLFNPTLEDVNLADCTTVAGFNSVLSHESLGYSFTIKINDVEIVSEEALRSVPYDGIETDDSSGAVFIAKTLTIERPDSVVESMGFYEAYYQDGITAFTVGYFGK